MTDLSLFEKYLADKQLVPDKNLPFYLHWVSRFLSFCKKQGLSPNDDNQIKPFLHVLAKTKEEWQVTQAREALRIFLFYLAQANEMPAPKMKPLASDQAWRSLTEQTREALRLRHRSIRTEKAYLQWLHTFYRFMAGKNILGVMSPLDD